MSINLKHIFKGFLSPKSKDPSTHKYHSKLDDHNQDVMDIIGLIPIKEFYDGIDTSAFFMDPKLLIGFLGPELGGAISDMNNNFFDLGFESITLT